ncbi:DUF418 domain-containing protein [Rufibacter psychrotolerans]|uniref:DUF418 domain-containing protein n=1 Tax=Rufibacter psychrotolerans TaxID=2812556 RepID=UPI00196884CB|nr:DUF418 domain-containing protein [Rufibacter sp. SYSU D00308]
MELPQSANLPLTANHNRLSSIDLVRGFALLGIGLENLFSMHTQNADFAQYAAQYPQELNHWLLTGLMVLVRSKFYPIFSFVFGMSAALSLPQRGAGYFLRRLAALFGLGILQTAFVWNGDVLTHYAAMGILLLLLCRLPTTMLFILAGLLLTFSFTGELWVPAEIHNAPEMAQKATTAYTSGTFGQITVVRLTEFAAGFLNWEALWFLSRIFAFLLLGYTFTRAGGLRYWQNKYQVLRAFVLLAVGVGLVALWFQVAGWRGEGELSRQLEWVKQLLFTAYFFGLVGCYLLLPVLLYHWLPLKKANDLLIALGQHTLTHYLLQNLLFSLLFYHYGAGLYGKLAPWQCFALYILVISVQLALSHRWSKQGQRGPVEALLRYVVRGRSF